MTLTCPFLCVSRGHEWPGSNWLPRTLLYAWLSYAPTTLHTAYSKTFPAAFFYPYRTMCTVIFMGQRKIRQYSLHCTKWIYFSHYSFFCSRHEFLTHISSPYVRGHTRKKVNFCLCYLDRKFDLPRARIILFVH